MSTPYGGNDPQQWGQQPGGYPQSGYPGQEQAGQWGQQYPPSGPQPQQQYPGYQQPAQPPYEQQWQQPQQQYPPQQGYGGYGQYPSFEPDQPKKSNTWLWVTLAVVVLAAGAFVVLGFVAPGFLMTKTFDATGVEKGVVQILGKDAQVENVQCPDEQKVEQGHTFTCTATVNGEQKEIPITVTDAEADPPVYRVDGPK
ncbi:MAG: DUF4333 domain-containing protein [Thermocrispum sp.]